MWRFTHPRYIRQFTMYFGLVFLLGLISLLIGEAVTWSWLLKSIVIALLFVALEMQFLRKLLVIKNQNREGVVRTLASLAYECDEKSTSSTYKKGNAKKWQAKYEIILHNHTDDTFVLDIPNAELTAFRRFARRTHDNT